MEFNITEIFNSDNNYKISNAMYQHWNSKSYSYKTTPRPNNGVLFITDGKIDFIHNDGTLTAKSGNIIFLPKGSSYEAQIKPQFGDTYNYLINFTTDIPIAIPKTPIKIVNSANHIYENLFGELCDTKITNSLNCFKAKSIFYRLLDCILEDSKTEYLTNEASIQKAHKLLGENLELPLSEIAKICSISQSGLRNLFAKTYGISPMEYRMTVKINKAKYLLQATDFSVNDIALSLGFFDSAYFCKVFKERVGCSPKSYSANKRL